MPQGKELETLSEIVDPANIPRKYGGEFDFSFGKPPQLDDELQNLVTWASDARDLPLGPMKWVVNQDGGRDAIAVGTKEAVQRKSLILTVSSQSETSH